MDRTAYPQYRGAPTRKELEQFYQPTESERHWAYQTSRGPEAVLTRVILLKVFQHLGYFPRPHSISSTIVSQIRAVLGFPPEVVPQYPARSFYRHQEAIRLFLKVVAYGHQARHVAIQAMAGAAYTQDHPVDLINVALEELICQRYELPAFSTLDRMARRIRNLVNQRFYRQVHQGLYPPVQATLETLLERAPNSARSPFDQLKSVPKSTSRQHVQIRLDHLAWLQSLSERLPCVDNIPPAKVRHWAAEARALDASEMRKMSLAKRHTLLICLIQRAQVTTRDELANMLIKTMGRIHQRGREALQALHEQSRAQTETLVDTLAEVIAIADPAITDAEVGKQVRTLLLDRGGREQLQNTCEAVTAYHGQNYLPLLWRFFQPQRRTLWRLVETLEFMSTSHDSTLINALASVKQNAQRKGRWWSDILDLSFATEPWRRTIKQRNHGTERLLRRPLEVCILSTLAQELKAGDIAVKGSEQYADYRDQLLSVESCEPLIAPFCTRLGFATTAQGFVATLKKLLDETAALVDAGYPANDQVVIIPEKGQPVLKETSSSATPTRRCRIGGAGKGPDARTQCARRIGSKSSLDGLVHSFWPLIRVGSEIR